MTQREPDRIVTSMSQGPEQRRLYRNLIRRSGVAVSPAESWALWHLGARGPITAPALAGRLNVHPAGLGDLFEALGRRGYVQPDRQGVPSLTSKGRHALVALIRAGQDELSRLIHGAEPADQSKRAQLLRRLTRAALKTMPAAIPSLSHRHSGVWRGLARA
jgi:DNA-binding MarR family transcriptional regulator